MNEISLLKLSEIISGDLTGNSNQTVTEILTDSRSIVSSEKSVFFALKGIRNDGHLFIENLYERGIINFIITEYKKEFEKLKEANFILVKNTLEALHKLGDYHRDMFSKQVVAVVGSNGKTIVKEWLYQLLNKDFYIFRSPKSFNSQLGVPLSLCLIEKKYQKAIIEAGISMLGEMERLEKIIKPDVVIFTSFGEAHQENFNSFHEKADEKLKMLKRAKTIIYSLDNPEVSDIVKFEKKYSEKETFTRSYKNKDADIYVEKVNRSETKTKITVIYKTRKINYTIPFIDEASIDNSLSCLAYFLFQHLLSDRMLRRFETLEQVEMRVEQKQAINNCILINDSYNSDIVSLKVAVDLLNRVSKNKEKILILSDIIQSGTKDSELYKTVSEILQNNKIDKLIGIGKRISLYKSLFKEFDPEFYQSTKAFLKEDLRKKFNNDAILLKGSRVYKFEKISKVLELKKHRTVLEINMEALIHNLKYYESLLLPKTKKMIMVKAISYGSGTSEIAELLQHHQVDYLGVAIADEGVKLRKAGITTKIMVMNPDENSISDIVKYRLEPEIYSFKILHSFLNETKDYLGKKLPVHIKIDTGMKRLGFCDFEVDELIEYLKQSNKIFVKSIFSHLVASGEKKHDDFTNKQINNFKAISEKIEKKLKYSTLKHILNTSGTERFPQAQFDMVRIGIGLYGFSETKNDMLMNVSTLKTKISQIKSVKTNETVGYSRSWTPKKETKIAIIPIGYADGLSRRLSNNVGEVIINGKKAPIIGNVCMDMCMVDVGSLNVKEGDEVIIFGDEYPASEIAKKLETIPYEIIACISERVKRVYLG